ncbi:KIR protein [Plasmodium coatneyi]|uniref:KIR protein n=1 Tax=Plasmodium coatneyi TaxID=208452 RepID=A0A1B1E1L2_9APIC|nr:KIR protein [Plasmodium coatneyi]ANQ08918.1 KIR protein [Plasmodium coatneyi]
MSVSAGSTKSVKSPAWDVYYKFWTPETCSEAQGYENYGSTLAKTLGKGIQRSKVNIQGGISIIARGWCNAYKIKRENQSLDYDPCDFLYYWLGTRVKQNWKNENFPQVIKTIYDSFPRVGNKTICTDKYPDISKDLFEKSKELFDFFYNYGTAIDELSKKGLLKNEKCNTSLGKAKEAYESIQSACSGESETSTYCIKLKGEYGQYFEDGQKKWECPVDPARAEKAHEDVIIGKGSEIYFQPAACNK